MKTIDYLTQSGLFWPAVVAGLAIATLCALLSVLVVLKRMAFIGQGISHAALGGIGVAAAAGVLGSATGAGLAAQFAIVLAFCLGSGLLIGWMSRRRGAAASLEADTAIGIVLVASMSLGAVLLHAYSRSTVSWESFLFGSLMDVGWPDAWIAWGVALATLATLWLARRPLLFWAFDASGAAASGVRGFAMQLVLLTLLSLATVTAMKLAGVVLATAMLVLPGAAALRLSDRLWRVLCLAGAFALLGVCGGLVISFELDWLPGASIVAALCAIFALARVWEAVGRRAGA
jgi:ABC-type Mn2+/Zn2+ transport system permease subunit